MSCAITTDGQPIHAKATFAISASRDSFEPYRSLAAAMASSF